LKNIPVILVVDFYPRFNEEISSNDTATDIMTDLVKVEHVHNFALSVLQGSAETLFR